MPLTAEQLIACIENPTKTHILTVLGQKGRATARQLLAADSTIPQATLYRALKSMQQAGIIEVVAEAKVRALTEKTYALTEQFLRLEDELLQNNNGQAYARMFSGFALGLVKRFEQYARQDSIDIAADGSSFNAFPVYATAQQLAACGRQIADILAPYTARQSDDQQLHTFAAIVTPPIEQEA